jgi:hypothetical protein
MKYQCPVCFYAGLPYPPADYHICLCCGTEFGNDDEEFSHAQLREMWIASGAQWFFRTPPAGWNPWVQLLHANMLTTVPGSQTRVVLETSTQPLSQQIYGTRRPSLVVVEA